MPFDPYQIPLPITDVLAQVHAALQQENTLIVTAPPGAGKSTLLPLSLLTAPWLEGKKIILLEPRRLAAKTIAMRMAALLGEEVGHTVGYRVRFENRVSQRTRLEVVTEGILTRQLHSDNALSDTGLVIFDEFHERSLNADLAMALCREAQQVLRPDLRLLVMSATLNMPQLSALLACAVVESQGRQHPVDIVYSSDADETLLPELMARAIATAAREQEGDLLAFFPGEAEIRRCEELLATSLHACSIHPLYGQLSPQEQLAAILPNKQGRRKVVLATSIAETSLTIEGVRVVVDSGFGRVQRFDPRSGLSRLETVRISKDAADQRAGRAGRLSSGVCYRLWTRATHERLADHRVPEILEADLTALALDLALWGVHNIASLTWLNAPPAAAVAQARDSLAHIEAISGGKITAHGKAIHQLACHPRIAHLLLRAKADGAAALATDLAAVLEERDPLPRDSGIDINLRIEALRRARAVSSQGGRFARIEKIAASYRRLLGVEADNGPVDVFETGLLLACAFPERIAAARPGNNAQFQLANGKYALVGHKDDLANAPWLAVAHMDLRDGLGKVFLAAPLNPKDLKDLVREQEVITWDTRRGGLIASKDLRIGSIVLQSKPLPEPPREAVEKALLAALEKEGEQLLDFNDDMVQLQNRISSLAAWNPDQHWPDVNTAALLQNCGTWLGPYLAAVRRPDDLKKITLANALFHALDWEQQQALDRLAPARIEVPSGSKIKISYLPHGGTPVLAVRLQEVFGLADTPALNGGRTKVVLHLLSPGYKPVQVTSDLRSFWNNMYHEVKKELQRKYPKHAWPSDPWTAPAVAKGRSHKH